MNASYPRSPHAQVGGMVYFGRMVDKIRLHHAGALHPDLQANLGTAFDQKCCDFLGVAYADLVAEVQKGISDEEALAWCRSRGKNPDTFLMELWNGYMTKRGWNDALTPKLRSRLAESGFADRSDILTMFDYIDLDEGRDPAKQS